MTGSSRLPGESLWRSHPVPTGPPAHYVEAIELVRKQTCEAVLELGLDRAEQEPSQVLLFGDPDRSSRAVEVSAWTLDGQPRGPGSGSLLRRLLRFWTQPMDLPA